jgi:hypothetical protein
MSKSFLVHYLGSVLQYRKRIYGIYLCPSPSAVAAIKKKAIRGRWFPPAHLL